MLIKSDKQDFPVTPQGLHTAVCYGLVDCGTHEEVWQGQPHDRHVLFVLFELPTETIEIDGVTKPRGISQKYTLSLHPKSALRRDLESWRGKNFTNSELVQGFELKDVLGKNCQLNIVHNETEDRTYANINTIVPLGQGMQKYEPFNPVICYEIEDGANVPESVPDWLREKIFASFEMNMTGQQNEEWDQPSQEPDAPIDDDDIPF